MRPYFCLIGHSSRRALSRLALSGQLLSGAKRCWPAAGAAAAVGDAIGAGAVPGHADEQAAVMAEIRRPPLLRVGHQRAQVGDHRVEVEALEFLCVIECLAHGIGARRMLMQDLHVQMIRPPVAICMTALAAAERAFARAFMNLVVHLSLRLCSVM